MSMIKSFFGLSSAASTEDLLKFLGANVGGKLAAVVGFFGTTAYIFGPLLPEKIQPHVFRIALGSIFYLIVIMFWRQGRNTKLMVSTLASNVIADPTQANVSPIPAVQREIDARVEEANK